MKKNTRFCEVARFRNGINFLSTDKGHLVKIIGVSDFGSRTKLDEYHDLATISVANDLAADDAVSDNDLLFVRSNGNRKLIGRCIVIKDPPPNTCHSGFTIRATIDQDKVMPQYVSLVFQTKLIKEQIGLLGSGTNISNLSQEILKNIEFYLPTKRDQRLITQLVETWDSAIEKTERLIDLKKKQYKHYSELLLLRADRKKRRVEATNNRYLLPPEWRHARIGDFASEITVLNKQNDNFPVLSCTKHQGFVESLRYFKKQIYSKNTSVYKVIKKGQFAYATNHIEEGSIGYLGKLPGGLLSPMYTVFEIDTNQVNPMYFYNLLKTSWFVSIFKKLTSSSVDRRGSLRWSQFKKIDVLLPSLNEQNKTELFLESAYSEIKTLQEISTQYKQQKSFLVSKLLTGEWEAPELGARRK